MSDNTSLLTVSLLLEELKEVTDWYMLGAYLNVPVHELKKIEKKHDEVERCKLEMLEYWLNTTITASWKDIARALEQLNMLTLAVRLKSQYLWTPAVVKSEGVSTSSSSSSTTTAITASELTRSPPPPSSASQPTELSSDATAEIETDRKIVEELRDLVSGYSLMLTKFKRLLAGCDISDARFFLNKLFNTDIFTRCENFEQLLNHLCHRYVDTFNVYYLQQLATCLERDDVTKLVNQYEEKKDNFLKQTTVLNFHKAIISKTPVLPKGMAKITIRIPKEFATDKILKDMEELAIKAFGDSYHSRFVQFHVIAGSVVICWFVVESLCEVLQQLAREKVAVWRQHGVEEVMVGSLCVYCSSSKKEEVVKQYYSQRTMRESSAEYGDYETFAKTIKTERAEEEFDDFNIPPLKTESTWKALEIEERLQNIGLDAVKTQVKCEVAKENEKERSGDLDVTTLKTEVQQKAVITELNAIFKNTAEEEIKKLKKRIVDLEEFVKSDYLCFHESLIQVTGISGQVITTGNKTSIELSTSSQTSTTLPFPINQLSCQLTDPQHQRVPCSITSTQPGVCTVTYTPTLRGPHQLGIAINETDIPGSPFTLRVLPSPEMRGVVQRTITGVSKPRDVAVSKSGEVVVTDNQSHCSVYNREGKKLWSFATQSPAFGTYCIAVTSDNLQVVLVSDHFNHQIKAFTTEGIFCTSVGQKGNGPLQFNYPSGIAVHPSGQVFVADTNNRRIQVLHPDLTYSHMFGSMGSAPGQFGIPYGVACDNNGVVYVTDSGYNRVQLFSTEGQFISSFGSERYQQGQLYSPRSICIDSTNTVYITDQHNRVSVYTGSGQFIKWFGTKRSGELEGKSFYPQGVAVDNTTGALYVCDFRNDCVVVY